MMAKFYMERDHSERETMEEFEKESSVEVMGLGSFPSIQDG